MVTNHILKQNAKLSLTKNYFKLVLASFIIFFSTTGMIVIERMISGQSITSVFGSIIYPDWYSSSGVTTRFIVVRIVYILLNYLLLKPLIVINDSMFYKNSVESSGSINYFKLYNINFKLYFKYILVSILRSLLILFYLILFIIPGFVKFYQLRDMNYVLLKNPDMPIVELFEESKKLVYGHKTKMVSLDISFIPLFLLSLVTGFIAHIFYVGPLYRASYAELFDSIERKEYSLKYADSRIYNTTDRERRVGDMILGLSGQLLLVLSSFFLYFNSSKGVSYGISVNTSWLENPVRFYIISIALACVGIPLFYRGIRGTTWFTEEKLGKKDSPHGNVQSTFRLSATFAAVTQLAVHILLCSAPVLFKIMNSYIDIENSTMILNNFAMYLTIPVGIMFFVPSTIVSITFMYMIFKGLFKVKKWVALFNPLTLMLVCSILGSIIPVYFIKDILKIGASFGWFFMMLSLFVAYIRELKEDFV